MNPEKISILGPGLLGGSLVLALRESGYNGSLSLWARRPEAVAEIESLGLPAVASTDLISCVKDAALIILCTPVETMPDLLTRCLPSLPMGCIVTDVGSVKGNVVAALEKIAGDQVRVVGSHPMAGSEKTGIRHAKADLFRNAPCIVTPTPATDSAALERVKNLWALIGCRVIELSPVEHDRAVARISHLPHLAASALVNLLGPNVSNAATLCGNGFLDTTRVASGSPDLWTGILEANREEVIAALDDFINSLILTKEVLEQRAPDGIKSFLEQAKTARDTVKALRNHGST